MNLFNKLTIISAAFVLVFLAQTCKAADWPTQYSNNQNNPVVFDTFRQNNSTYTVNPGTSIYNLQPVIGDGKIFYALGSSTTYNLYAVSLENGTEIWHKTFPRQILNIVYDNGRIYFGSVNIYSLDANTGAEIWKTNLCSTSPNEVLCRVLRVEDGKVYGSKSISTSANLLVIDKTTGSILQNRSDIAFSINATILSDDNSLYIVNPTTATNVIKVNKSDFIKSTPFAVCPVSSAGSILDKENSIIYLTANNYLCSYDLKNSQIKINMTSGTYGGFAKYGNTIYAKGNYSLNKFPAGETDPWSSYYKTVPFSPYTAPLIVNGVLYFGSSDGRIWGINLETEEVKTWNIEAGTAITGLIYANGQIIASGRVSNIDKLFVLDLNNLSLRPTNFTISLESPYKTDGDYIPLLGQLHSHYLPESPLQWLASYNIMPTPYDIEKRYKDAGYDFVALTEHNQIVPNPGVDGLVHISSSEEITPDGKGGHILALGINNLINFALPDQEKIDGVINQNGVPILAHPNYNTYPWPASSLNELQNFKHLEIFQGAGRYFSPFTRRYGDYYATDKFDLLASAGKNIYGTAGDDYTPMDGGFDQAAVTVFSETKDQPAIIQNLKEGNFYARQGSSAPNITINVSGSTIFITSDKTSEIKFIGIGGKTLKTDYLTQFSTYNATGDESYVRAEVTCANGIDLRTSWTQPIKVNKNKTTQSLTSGTHYFDLGQTSLAANTTETANASVLPSPEYPAQSPPLGYLSQVYSLSTTGQVLDGTNLSINYADKGIFTNENNLAIYSYDEAGSSWNKVASNVDKANKIVSANLSHFSLYTLSAEQPVDAEKPIVSLTEPTNLTDLSDQIIFVASANDNNAVTEVRFSVDDKPVAKDTDMSDGWKAAVDANDFSIGSHKLKLEAEDFSGNIGNFETTFTITNSMFIAPTVSLSTPANGQYLKDKFMVSGNYSSQNEVKNISVYLNEIYITDADFSSGTFQKEIDFGQFKEGKHVLKIALVDIKGNISDVTTTMNVGDELKINIVSPQKKSYLHSESILFQYQTTPGNVEGVTAKLDDQIIANNTFKNAFELSLGQHKFNIEKNGKIYAETNFIISTNLIDQIRLAEKLYSLGHIKNRGILTAIQAHLVVAEVFDKFGMRRFRDQFIEKAADFIIQQSEKKKPLIDDFAEKIFLTDLNLIRRD